MHMRTMDVRTAQRELESLLRGMDAGDEVVLFEGQERVGMIIAAGGRPSLRDIQPASVGSLLRAYPDPDAEGDDLLGEMLDR